VKILRLFLFLPPMLSARECDGHERQMPPPGSPPPLCSCGDWRKVVTEDLGVPSFPPFFFPDARPKNSTPLPSLVGRKLDEQSITPFFFSRDERDPEIIMLFNFPFRGNDKVGPGKLALFLAVI